MKIAVIAHDGTKDRLRGFIQSKLNMMLNHTIICTKSTSKIVKEFDLDVSAVESIHKLIVNQRDEGSAVLLISEDLDELFKLSDRIIVLYEGRIIKEVDIESANIESLGLAMAGINE